MHSVNVVVVAVDWNREKEHGVVVVDTAMHRDWVVHMDEYLMALGNADWHHSMQHVGEVVVHIAMAVP